MAPATVDKDLQLVRERFIAEAGHTSQSLGVGRVIGQIFAHIYLSPSPQTLDDLTDALSISKGSASMTVRQLEQWGALKRVWIKGDRKDYYEASTEFGMVIRKILFDVVGRTVESSDQILEEAESLLEKKRSSNGDSLDFFRTRIRLLRLFRDRSQKIWDSAIVKMLLR